MDKKEIVKKLVSQGLSMQEREELIEMLVDNPIAVDIDKQEEKDLTIGDKLADKISEIAGSWTFIILFVLFLVFWIILNTYFLLISAAI